MESPQTDGSSTFSYCLCEDESCLLQEDGCSCGCHDPPPESFNERYINPVARVLLCGVLLPSPNSPFRILATCPDVIQIIYEHLRKLWEAAIIIGYDDDEIDKHGNVGPSEPGAASISKVALSRLTNEVRFPEPKGLVCNMLPFISDNFSTIPSEYHGYLDIIRLCQRYVTEPGRVWYLTIHESTMRTFGTQRRRGIHVEGFLARPAKAEAVPWWHYWGMGLGDSRFNGGVFHVSNVSNSCRMWNAQIPREVSSVLGMGCDVEHLRGALNDKVTPVCPLRGDLYWMTDATPHESLPLKEGTERQYFRLVTSEVSAWWEQHSTKNRLGVQPGCRIFKHSKFGKDAYVGFDGSDDG